MPDLPIRVMRVLPAPPAEVFDAWIDPESLKAWLCPGSIVEAIATLDVRVGGRFKITMREPAGEYVHTGEYLEIERPRRLVFTWISRGVRERLTRVTLDLRPHGEAGTELTLIHELMPDAEAHREHEGGWREIVAKLDGWLVHARGHRLPAAAQRLRDQVAVITGGNSGIGLAIARLFRAHGARLAILGRDLRSLREAESQLGDGNLAVQGDVRRLQDLDRLFDAVANRLGLIDVLVANAGIAKFSPLAELTEELFDEVSEINFKGVFFTVQKALPRLRDGGAVILVGAADADKRGLPLQSIYSATKAAVRSLARTLSAELLPRRIRVNVLSPGMTATPILDRDVGLASEFRDQLAGAISALVPVGRRGTPDDMARAALYLASSDSAYVLGAELVVDGGFSQVGTGG